METARRPESFRSLLLRNRGRTGLIQRDLAARASVSLRSVQDWEAGVTLPSAERLRGLIRGLFEAGGFTLGHENAEARELWTVVQSEAPRMHASFDDAWFAELLAQAPSGSAPARDDTRPAEAAERARDWGEAPDTS